MNRGPVLLLAVLCLAVPVFAAQPQFWKLEGARDFLDGDTTGLSIDSEGRMRLAPSVTPVHDPEAPTVWTLAADGGRLVAGTGNDGRVVRLDGEKPGVVFDAPELEVHALAYGRDGRLFAGTGPDGKVYAIDKDGKSTTFFDPADKYIWSMATDREGRLLVATGGEGRVHRVSPSGAAEVLLAGPESHVTALAVDAAGHVYAGTSPGGIVYRIDAAGKAFVLHDSSYREVKALQPGKDGAVYAAVIEGRDTGSATPSFFSSTTTSAASAEVTITESFTLGAVTSAGAPTAPTPSPTPRPVDPRGGTKGAVLRISASGEIDTLWSSTDEMPHALAATDDGVLVGTGNKGQVYLVHDDRTWTMVTTLAAEQVTSLLREPSGMIAAATSNPGKIVRLGARPGAKGTFTSKVRDTDTVSTWGRVRWDGEVPAGTRIEVQTRSGNTSTPDSTWSDWSAVYRDARGEGIASPHARFLQFRVALAGPGGVSPELDSLSAAYLQRNLRPQVTSITVHPPGEVFQRPISLSAESEILGLDQAAGETRGSSGTPRTHTSLAAATTYSRRMFQRGLQTFSWRGEDPNGDTLSYDVHYRTVGDRTFRLLKKGVSEAVLAWDTSTVPNGRYVVRVTASDAPGNPEALALSSDRESAPFDVDNTPPAVGVTAVASGRIRVAVKDDTSYVRKAEFSLDGGRWQEIHPVDGINDGLQETYEFAVGPLDGPAPHVVVVRAMDALGNASTGQVELR
jgi:hypothetical protein